MIIICVVRRHNHVVTAYITSADTDAAIVPMVMVLTNKLVYTHILDDPKEW